MAKAWKPSFDADDLLKQAFKANDLDTAIAAVKFGADPYTVDGDGIELVHRYAQAGEIELVELMISKGYDVNAPSRKLGLSLLMTSIEWYFVDQILEHGANPNYRAPKRRGTDGDTALTLACGSGGAKPSLRIVQALLRAGANPNLPRADGWTPLMLAAEHDQPHIAYALLLAGANPNLAKAHGTTALDIAQQHSHKRVLHFLKAFIAEKSRVALTRRFRANLAAIRQWHAKRAKARIKAVGATKTQLAQLVSTIGRPLTDELHVLLALIGRSDDGVRFPGTYRSLSVASILEHWKRSAALRKAARFVPFAEDGSRNLLCVDLGPDEDGAMIGPVVHWDARKHSVRRLAPTLEAYLDTTRNEITSGQYRYSDDANIFFKVPPPKRQRQPIEESTAELIRLRPEFQKMLSASRVIDTPVPRVQLSQLGGEGGPTLRPLTAARKKEIASIRNKSWQLAAAWPMTQAELAAAARRHRRPSPPFNNLWQRSDLSDYSCACRRDGSTRHANFDRRDLRGVSFAGLSLGGAQLNAAIADNVDFSDARLDHALLTDLRAPGACFDGAKLHGADFSQSNLRGASFRNAYLRGTDFEDCDLTGCDFTGADVKGVQNVPPRFATRLRA